MLGILLTQAAFGCGGLFCNSISYDSTPVNQAVEEILFAVNEDEGTVTTHVKIFFEGNAADFSWVVPVPEIPEIEIGTNAFFDALDRTRGEWHKQEIYDCQTDLGDSSSTTASATVASTYSAGTTSSFFGVSGVEVVDTKAVGPYETVT